MRSGLESEEPSYGGRLASFEASAEQVGLFLPPCPGGHRGEPKGPAVAIRSLSLTLAAVKGDGGRVSRGSA